MICKKTRQFFCRKVLVIIEGIELCQREICYTTPKRHGGKAYESDGSDKRISGILQIQKRIGRKDDKGLSDRPGTI